MERQEVAREMILGRNDNLKGEGGIEGLGRKDLSGHARSPRMKSGNSRTVPKE